MSQRKRWQHKGRSDTASFVTIPHFVLQSDQWAAMDAYAMKLLFELVRQYRGNNNGDLSATADMLKDRHNSWASKDTLPRKLRHLEDHGWIIRTRQGGRHIGCNLYAITWWPANESEKHGHPAESKPSHAWKNATGTPSHGEQYPATRGARPIAPRDTGSKVVRIRSQA